MALGNVACNVGDQRCDLGVDLKESSHSKQTGGAASELLGGFNLFALALCCGIADVFVVGFLSKPDELSAYFHVTPRNDRKPTFGKCGRHRDHSLSGIWRNLKYLRFRHLRVRA